MVNPKGFMALLALAAGVAGCASSKVHFHDAAVTSIGSDQPTPLCVDFSLSDEQALQFLRSSEAITAQQMHDNYNYLPCYVRGRVVRAEGSKQSCDFTIRAGGTAELNCEDGQGYIYACETCEELLTD